MVSILAEPFLSCDVRHIFLGFFSLTFKNFVS